MPHPVTFCILTEHDGRTVSEELDVEVDHYPRIGDTIWIKDGFSVDNDQWIVEEFAWHLDPDGSTKSHPWILLISIDEIAEEGDTWFLN